jgi:NAD(P)-dependent dehydrogenase (short-subunit alcohol dehydrogenase family)
MSTSRTAVVTGGMSGIGAAVAARLAADQVKVITFDVAPGADLSVDVTDPGAVRAAAQQVGPIDILINSAGIVGSNASL